VFVQLLAGDKGMAHPDSFRGLGNPHIAFHRSFSVMVNFHALRLWAELLHGFSMHTRHVSAADSDSR
jgi:hypothetical protein